MGIGKLIDIQEELRCEIELRVDKLKKEKIKGEKWTIQAAGVLIKLSQGLKMVEGLKEEATRPLKIKYDLAAGAYTDIIGWIKKMDKNLREMFIKNYKGEENVQVPDGEIVLKHSWTYRIMDIGKVPAEYLTADSPEITAAIREGVRNIPGIDIFKTRTIAVTPVNKDATACNSDQMEG